jgi:hypothetical protein
MKSFLRTLLVLAFGVFGIFAVEQILYRFSEDYAKMRADWLWSLSEEDAVRGWLSVFPFDQWERFPTHDGKASLAERLEAETNYTLRSLSHTRALRDKLYEELLTPALPSEVPLRKTRALGGVTIQIPLAPNGTRATILQVLRARKEYNKEELRDIILKLETQFTPMVRQSFAFGIIHAANEREILSAMENLAEFDNNYARRILAWGKGESANLLANVASVKPELFVGLVLESPAKVLPPPPVNGPFVFFLTGKQTSGKVAWNALEWIERLRNENFKPGADRLSGLLADGRNPANYQTCLAYGFIMEVDRAVPVLAKMEGSSASAAGLPAVDSSVNPGGGHVQQIPETVYRNEEDLPSEAPVVSHVFSQEEVEPSSPPDKDKLFDCKILRDYRRITQDPQTLKLSNKDLTLKLGRQFEQAGVLDRIGEQDPQFIENYESFKVGDRGI